MQLVRNARRDSDTYVRVDDDASLPGATDVIVSLARWLERRASDSAHAGRLGVLVPADADIDTLGTSLDRLDLVVLDFPAFVDGRHYSNAVRLRGHYGFRGEIRAAGDVARDQLDYLNRCGFDAFELGDDVDVDAFLRGLDEFSDVYQYAHDGRTPAYRLRTGFS